MKKYIILLNSDPNYRILNNWEKVIKDKFSKEYIAIKCVNSDEAIRAIKTQNVTIIFHAIHDDEKDDSHLALLIDRKGIKQVFFMKEKENILMKAVEDSILIEGGGELTFETVDKILNLIKNNSTNKAIILFNGFDETDSDRDTIEVSDIKGGKLKSKFMDDFKYAKSDKGRECDGIFKDGKFHIAKTLREIKYDYPKQPLFIIEQEILISRKHIHPDYTFNIDYIIMDEDEVLRFSTRLHDKLREFKIKSLNDFFLYLNSCVSSKELK